MYAVNLYDEENRVIEVLQANTNKAAEAQRDYWQDNWYKSTLVHSIIIVLEE